jgi:hypothetical protein
MEEQQTSTAPTISLPGATWRDWRWLALLLLLTSAMRLWQVWHTEVPSRDSIGFIRLAWRIEQDGPLQAIRSSEQHPGYPMLLLGTSKLVRAVLGQDLVRAMQLAAQLASALASVLLVFPMFYLGKALFDGRVAFWATWLFQCLPATGVLMADGLSEPLFLLFASTSLALGLFGFRTASWWLFALAGLAGGLAYLTRAEGAVVPFSIGVILLAALFVRRWGWSRRACLRCGAALSVTALLVAAPFVLLIGGLSNKPSYKELKGTQSAPAPDGVAQGPLPFAVWDFAPDVKPQDRYGWALWALGVELAKGFFYVLWFPALLALVWFRDRCRSPGPCVLLLLCLLMIALLYRVAQSGGYLSARHAALVVLLSSYWAVAGLAVLAARLAALLSRWRMVRAERLALALLLALAVAPLGQTLATLHADRAAFRQAGAWLAQNAGANDDVVDPYVWSWYYAGRIFVERPAHPTARYVVLEESDNAHKHLYHVLDDARALAARGKPVMRFPVKRSRKPGELVVYRVPAG